MPTEFVMLPPQTEKTREWGVRLAAALPEMKVIVAENHTHAAQVIANADAVFGTIPPDLLRQAQRLRWLQAPQAAPPAGYYYPELIAHPVQITNFREIYNDHIGAHVMAFVLAFARGLHHYIPQQIRREWNKLPQDTGVIHLPEATALVVGVGGIGSEVARLCAAFGMHVIGVDERRRDVPPGVAELHRGDELDALLPAADFVILTVPLPLLRKIELPEGAEWRQDFVAEFSEFPKSKFSDATTQFLEFMATNPVLKTQERSGMAALALNSRPHRTTKEIPGAALALGSRHFPLR